MFTKAQAEAYFIAEKQESLLFLGIGIAAIAAALVLLFVMKTPFHKGMAIPLIAVGLIQVVVGYTVYARSDEQRKDIVYRMDLNPSSIASAEIPRMEKVMKNFVVYRWIEIALIAAGVTLVLLYRSNAEKSFAMGIGITLTVQAALMLGADYFAEQRGGKYLIGLKEWISSPR